MTGHNPTDRSKLGTKRHILTDKEGIPLSTVITYLLKSINCFPYYNKKD